MIEIQNPKLYDFLVKKEVLVNDGRKISREIELMEIKIRRLEEKEKKITMKVRPPKDKEERGNQIVKEIERLDKEMSKLLKEIDDARLAAVPKEMKDEHLQLLKDKEVKERERNKIALKIQKIKDRVIPVIQKHVKPLLGEYEDIETAQIKDGKVVINTFNYLEEWKRKFHK